MAAGDDPRGEREISPMRAPRSGVGLGSLLVAVLIVLALGVGTVYAAIPNGSGTYRACLVKANGTVKLINFPKVSTCPKGERLITWNAKGPAGPAGPQGAEGAQGPQGPQGPSGSSHWGDIADKPAGFADGVDDIGPSYASSIIYTWPGQLSGGGAGANFDIQHLPLNVDFHFSVIPTAATWMEITQVGVIRNVDGTLTYNLVVKNYWTASGLKIRATAFADGIAPAAHKQQLKHVKVKVIKQRRRY
jgi:hypothetical protein